MLIYIGIYIFLLQNEQCIRGGVSKSATATFRQPQMWKTSGKKLAQL